MGNDVSKSSANRMAIGAMSVLLAVIYKIQPEAHALLFVVVCLLIIALNWSVLTHVHMRSFSRSRARVSVCWVVGTNAHPFAA